MASRPVLLGCEHMALAPPQASSLRCPAGLLFPKALNPHAQTSLAGPPPLKWSLQAPLSLPGIEGRERGDIEVFFL